MHVFVHLHAKKKVLFHFPPAVLELPDCSRNWWAGGHKLIYNSHFCVNTSAQVCLRCTFEYFRHVLYSHACVSCFYLSERVEVDVMWHGSAVSDLFCQGNTQQNLSPFPLLLKSTLIALLLFLSSFFLDRFIASFYFISLIFKKSIFTDFLFTPSVIADIEIAR